MWAKQFGAMGPKESKMRSNAMKTCAMGAMLFGGTLGTASAANAGLVVWNCNVSMAYSYGSYGLYMNVKTQQTTVDDGSGNQPAGTDLYFGWGSKLSIIATNPGQTVGVTNFGGATVFGVARLASGTIIGSSLASGISWGQGIDIVTNAATAVAPYKWVQGASNYFGFSFMTASNQRRYAWGEITLNAGSNVYGTINRIVYDDTGASVTAGVVPAPGAFALVGLAGMITSRRRKA